MILPLSRFAATLLLAGTAFLALGCGAGKPPDAASKPATAEVYHCPMHPQVVSDKPGQCPICSMSLVRRQTEPPPTAGHEHGSGAEASGRTTVVLSPEKRQLLGIKTAVVARRPLVREMRTVGRVTVDERRVHHVHTKYEAYVEHLHVDYVGKFVKRGEPLVSLYSPDLVATQHEYLLAYRAQERLKTGIESVARGGADLLAAARQRLLLWDVRPEDIRALEQSGEVRRTLDLHSDVSGYVVGKMALHGMRVTAADTLFDIADLSRLWVLADVYESDLPLVRPGMMAELRVPYLPGQSWTGPVTYVAPTVEEKTRTVKVRVEIENTGERLKPDMFADVFLRSELGDGLFLPEGAVVRAGERDIAFVEKEGGRLEPREVSLGARLADGFQVLSGVEAGETVVTSANFLLDSESSLKAALAAMDTAAPAPAQPGHAGH